MNPKLIGRYIVADPKICHGKPTFRGTSVLVSDVSDQVASGMAWDTIIEEWSYVHASCRAYNCFCHVPVGPF